MKVQIYEDAGVFVRAHSAQWLKNEAENGAFLRLEHGIAEQNLNRAIYLAVLDDNDAVLQTVCVDPGDQIIFSRGQVLDSVRTIQPALTRKQSRHLQSRSDKLDIA